MSGFLASCERPPFALDDPGAYRRWRQWKLDTAPRRIDDLLVEVTDPRTLTPEETDALAARCRTANMAFYAGPAIEDKAIPVALGQRFGLTHLDANWLADEDGVSSITPREVTSAGPVKDRVRPDYIPYTERPIRWHTDGYYNPPARQIRGMVLHCVRPAALGGENAVLDHEIAYILLRDANPDYVRALCAPRAMSIPPRTEPSDAGDGTQIVRAEESGPVFSFDAEGDLHMRYTARTRSIAWHDDGLTRDAAAFLQRTLDAPPGECPWILRLRMQPGMGIVCNNVLHDRAGFSDPPDARADARRLLYRARFCDRIAQTRGSHRAAFACFA